VLPKYEETVLNTYWTWINPVHSGWFGILVDFNFHLKRTSKIVKNKIRAFENQFYPRSKKR
jgi:hypothetical protein